MALVARDIPVTREMVQGWIDDWRKDKSKKRPDLKTYIESQLSDKGHKDTMVDTHGHDQLMDQTPLLDMIWMDIGSYAGTES